MQIYTDNKNIHLKNTAVTLGKFDGIHRGHQKLIKRLLEQKEKLNLHSVLFSFDINTVCHQKSLTTKQERKLLCEKFQIDDVIFYPVNETTMSMEPERFIQEILIGVLEAKVIVTGKDFRFGKDRKGDVDMLRKYSDIYGYQLFVEESVNFENTKISSSTIRDYILNGNIEKANEMLGYPYFVTGQIVKGKQVGRTIGMRTINVQAEENKILPASGVYKTETELNGVKYKGLTNIGVCPTVSDKNEITVENHLLDFDEDVYGDIAKIEFIKYLRPEKKFNNLDELKKQILLDISQVYL